MPLMSVPLTELVAAALQGDADAWRRLVESHSRLVWSIIRSLAIAEPEASDVFQSVFLKMTEHLDRVQPEALPSWLITVTRRECYDVARRRQRLPVPTEELEVAEADSATMDERMVLSDEEAAVAAGLERLSERCQRLLRLLASSEEFSYTQISEIMDIPIGSIGPTRARCLERLARTPEVVRLGDAERWELGDG